MEVLIGKFGRLYYRLSNSGLLIFATLISSLIMEDDEYSLVVIGLPITILISAVIDYFPYKYLISFYSEKSSENPDPVGLLLRFKFIFALFTMPLFYFILKWYFADFMDLRIEMLFVLSFVSVMGLTFSSYYFVEKQHNNILLLPSPLIFIFFSLFFFPTYSSLLISIIIYRVVEIVVYLFFWRNISDSNDSKFSNRKHLFLDFHFYIQNLISVSGGKLFAIFIPSYLLVTEITILGNYMLLLSGFLFVSTFIASTYYVDVISKFDNFRLPDFLYAMKGYLAKSLPIIFIASIVFSFIGIEVYNLQFILILLVNLAAYISILSSMQAFLLFKMRLSKHIIWVSFLSFCINFILIYSLIQSYKLYAVLIASFAMEIFSVCYCYYFILRRINEKASHIFYKA